MGIVVAIDGPSGAGKSSTAKLIAHRAGWNYLDTGALYRGITWLSLEKNEQDPQKLLQLLKTFPLKFNCDAENPQLFVGDADVNESIRSIEVTERVSHIAAIPEIRHELLSIQRQYIKNAPRGIVVEGRDIGNVVAPESPLKLYLTADLEARALRREAEVTGVSAVEVKNSLDGRDLIDSTRKVSPLAMASDAVLIDSTLLNLEETVERVWELLRERNLLGLPIVGILGRPNVGKSTLINRFIGRREAIVEDTPGVTRDRVQYECEWGGRRFIIMDTGGWEAKPDGISVQVSAGSEIAMQEADVLAFVVDAQVGALDEDDILVQHLRKAKKPTILIGNKVDGEREEAEAHGLWSLGLGEPRFVSALHGRGSGDLLDHIVAVLPEVGRAQNQDGYRKVALIGRPNVGKSSLLNAMVGTERTIVSEIAGTTRDTIHTHYNLYNKEFVLIDTAGIRKKSKDKDDLEFYSIIRAIKAMDEADVCLLVIDADKGITAQDVTIFGLAARKGKGIVILVNKWDLVTKETNTARDYEKRLKEKIAPFTDVPIIFISVIEKTRIFKC